MRRNQGKKGEKKKKREIGHRSTTKYPLLACIVAKKKSNGTKEGHYQSQQYTLCRHKVMSPCSHVGS
jgi:hypothetical protein